MPTDSNAPACCALCKEIALLKQSHIVPQFAYRWLKDLAGKGYFHFGPMMTESGQAGLTRPFLCGECEARVSRWESQFARDVFHPLVDGREQPVKYQSWLLKFAISVCWRVLEDARRENRLAHFAGRWTKETESCLNTWRDYLLGRRPDVGVHDIQMLRWNGAAETEEAKLSAGIARYLQRTIEAEVACSDDRAFVYVKLGPVLLFGLIRDEIPKQWSKTRIGAEGKLKPGGWGAPAHYVDYVTARARRLEELTKHGTPERRTPADVFTAWDVG